MNIYFGTSPRIIEKFPEDIIRIYKAIEELGYRHTSNFVAKVVPKKFYEQNPEDFNIHHKETLKSINKAEICIFEASEHSLSIGYLVNYALDLGKPVIILSRNKQTPFMFQSLKSDNVFFAVYDNKDIKEELSDVIKRAVENIDIRFNFFITPRLISYLDWVSKNRRIPRSVYLRNLIEEDMKKNSDFLEETGK